MSVTWYNDSAAKRMHAVLHAEMAQIIERLCPGHELSHVGINRNDATEEVRLVLHLNPLGRVRVVPDRDEKRDQRDHSNTLLGTSHADLLVGTSAVPRV